MEIPNNNFVRFASRAFLFPCAAKSRKPLRHKGKQRC
jgi:hypothetical protein